MIGIAIQKRMDKTMAQQDGHGQQAKPCANGLSATSGPTGTVEYFDHCFLCKTRIKARAARIIGDSIYHRAKSCTNPIASLANQIQHALQIMDNRTQRARRCLGLIF
jgi:hypothetical protein